MLRSKLGLLHFIDRDMRMSPVYRPLLSRDPAAGWRRRTNRRLAMASLMEDDSQIRFYEDRI